MRNKDGRQQNLSLRKRASRLLSFVPVDASKTTAAQLQFQPPNLEISPPMIPHSPTQHTATLHRKSLPLITTNNRNSYLKENDVHPLAKELRRFSGLYCKLPNQPASPTHARRRTSHPVESRQVLDLELKSLRQECEETRNGNKRTGGMLKNMLSVIRRIEELASTQAPEFADKMKEEAEELKLMFSTAIENLEGDAAWTEVQEIKNSLEPTQIANSRSLYGSGRPSKRDSSATVIGDFENFDTQPRSRPQSEFGSSSSLRNSKIIKTEDRSFSSVDQPAENEQFSHPETAHEENSTVHEVENSTVHEEESTIVHEEESAVHEEESAIHEEESTIVHEDTQEEAVPEDKSVAISVPQITRTQPMSAEEDIEKHIEELSRQIDEEEMGLFCYIGIPQKAAPADMPISRAQANRHSAIIGDSMLSLWSYGGTDKATEPTMDIPKQDMRAARASRYNPNLQQKILQQATATEEFSGGDAADNQGYGTAVSYSNRRITAEKPSENSPALSCDLFSHQGGQYMHQKIATNRTVFGRSSSAAYRGRLPA